MLVSVIIPALNEADNIQTGIQCARRTYLPTEVEIVVVDGGSTDGTRSLISPDVTVISSPRGRATQMNHGAQVARGELLIFCHADTQLPKGWREAVIETLNTPGISGGAFQIAYLPPKGILHWVNRTQLKGNWIAIHGDRAQFMSRAVYDDIGGFPEIPLMEDVEMARELHRRGKIVLVPKRVIASSRRYVERGPLRQYALSIWLMFRYLFLGASPEAIARAYRSSREQYMGPSRTTKRGELYERTSRTQGT